MQLEARLSGTVVSGLNNTFMLSCQSVTRQCQGAPNLLHIGELSIQGFKMLFAFRITSPHPVLWSSTLVFRVVQL